MNSMSDAKLLPVDTEYPVYAYDLVGENTRLKACSVLRWERQTDVC